MANDDPKPTVELIKARTKIYPYEPGGVGTSIAEFLAGKAKLGRVTAPPPTELLASMILRPESASVMSYAWREWRVGAPERRSPPRS